MDFRRANRCLPGSAQWKKHLENWRLYAAAGGVSLAAATEADADIVYTSVNQTIQVDATTHSNHYTLRGVNGHSIKFLLTNNFQPNSGSRSAVAAMTGMGAGGIKFFSTGLGHNSIKNYAKSASIGGSPQNLHSQGFLLTRQTAFPAAGQFGSGYVGFRTNTTNAGGNRLGWIKVKVTDSTGYPTSIEIIGFAYNSLAFDQVGGSLKAGEQQAAVPEPGSMALGLLAMGAAGLVSLRRARMAQGE